MDYTFILWNALTIIAILTVKWLLGKFFPAYFTKKGENLATKEDIGEITRRMEEARLQYVTEAEKLKTELQTGLEKVKAELQKDVAAFTKRKELYVDMAKAIGVFVSGSPATPEQKTEFLSAYSTVWLLAPTSVIQKLNHLLDLQIAFAASLGSVAQDDLKNAYADCFLEMRKDAGFGDAALSSKDYRFVSF